MLQETSHDLQEAQARIDELASRARTERVKTPTGDVTWRSFGAGSPVVLLHGGHGSWLHWVRNIDALAAEHTVWVPNMPGYGDSDAVPDMDALLKALLFSLDVVLGADTATDLVGFSFGGLTAAILASRRPAGVQRLALLGGVGHGTRRRPIGGLMRWAEAYQACDTRAFEHAMRHNLAMHMLSVPAEEVDALALRVHIQACLKTRFRSKGFAQTAGLLDLLKARSGPTLLAWGEHDVTADPEVLVPQLAAALPRCETLIVRDAGHWVQYERAERINDLLLKWMREPLPTA